MEVRSADAGDVDAIRGIARRSWQRDYPGIASRETIDDRVEEWYGSDRMRAAVADPGTVVLVADAGDAVVGFAHATVSMETWTGSILRLYVDPDRRGEGLGGTLLDATVEKLGDRDCERIEAMVLADNELGNEFYRAAGFERVATGETVIGDGRHEEHRYVYRAES
jgi:ribosomal protein S18 acetylase RimI-like enzyme